MNFCAKNCTKFIFANFGAKIQMGVSSRIIRFAAITLNRGSTALCYCLTEDFKTVWKCHGLLYVPNKVTRYFKSQSLELLGCLTFNV